MSYPLSLTQPQVLTALRAVLITALPAGIEVVEGQDNRVPEPEGTDFVVMTPILRTRLETNTDLYQDAAFTGSISGTVLTVTAIRLGAISPPTPLFGVNIAPNTQITGQISGPAGGVGTYAVSVAQTLGSGPLAAGTVGLKQPTQITVQCDVHGPNSPDNCQIITTLFRSLFGANLFAAQGFDITALYAGDPRQSPFINAEQQIEMMWSIDAVLQANQIVTLPEEFADSATVAIPAPAA